MTITVLDSTGATQTLDPPTQTTLAAVLAKLSADPATQTTLAAILAKIEAAPATAAKQDALAALIGEVQASPTANTLLDRLKSIQTALSGSIAVTGTFYQATQPVSGTVTANLGTIGSAATAANQTTGNSSLSSIDGKTPALGQAVAGSSVPVVLPAAQITTLTPPTTVTANIGTVGTLATAAKQPALGTAGTPSADVLSVQGVSGGTPQSVGGNVASGAADSGNPVKIGGVYNTALPTLTNGQRGDLQFDSNSRLIIASTNLDPALGTNQTALNTAFGTTASSAATDDTGTWAFMALIKRLLGKTTTVEGTALASAARTATTNSADLTNDSCRGAVIFLSTTASSGTGGLQLRVHGKDPISGAYFSMNAAPTAVTGNGQSGYVVYPGASTAAGVVVQTTQTVLPRTFRIAVTHGDSSSYTYSVGYTLIP